MRVFTGNKQIIQRCPFAWIECPVCNHLLLMESQDFLTKDGVRYFTASRFAWSKDRRRPERKEPAPKRPGGTIKVSYFHGEDRCKHCGAWLGIVTTRYKDVNYAELIELDDPDKRCSPEGMDEKFDYEWAKPYFENYGVFR